ncbi:MAG: hypothetical protein ACRC10_07140 [Thermoguttaceae bacterium]
MTSSSKKHDQWSSLLVELGLEETSHAAIVAETAAHPTAPLEYHVVEQHGVEQEERTQEEPTQRERPQREERVQRGEQVKRGEQTRAHSEPCQNVQEPTPGTAENRSSSLETVKENFKQGVVPSSVKQSLSKTTTSAKSVESHKPVKKGKKSFIDRLASINLFGSASPEKVDRSGAVPGDFHSTTPLVEELEPKKLEKVDHERKKPVEVSREVVVSDTKNDPWSQLAAQLGVRIETEEKRTEEKQGEKKQEGDKQGEAKRREMGKEPVSSGKVLDRGGAKQESMLGHETEQGRKYQGTRREGATEEVPDIEALVSFRDLRKPKTAQPISPDVARSVLEPRSTGSSEQRENRAEPARKTDSRESKAGHDRDRDRDRNRDGDRNQDGARNQDSDRNRDSDRARNDDRDRFRGERGENRPRREERGVGTTRELEPIAEFSRSDVQAEESFEEGSDSRGRGRNRRRGNRESESFDSDNLSIRSVSQTRTPSQSESVIGQIPPFATLDEVEDDPLFGSNKKSQQRGRGTRRERSERIVDDVQEDRDDEIISPSHEREYGPSRDVFADLYSEESVNDGTKTGRLTRGSRLPREEDVRRNQDGHRKDVHRERDVRREYESVEKHREPVGTDEMVGERPFEQEGTRRSSRGRKGSSAIVDPQTELERQEARQLVQVHKSIPGWDDVVLPIVEQNISRHGNRRSDSSARPRNRRNKE